MQSGKWILTSLVMTFWHPHTGAIFGSGCCHAGAGLAAILEVCNLLFTPTIYLLLNVFMLTLGAIIIFSLVACGLVIAHQKKRNSRLATMLFSYPRY